MYKQCLSLKSEIKFSSKSKINLREDNISNYKNIDIKRNLVAEKREIVKLSKIMLKDI